MTKPRGYTYGLNPIGESIGFINSAFQGGGGMFTTNGLQISPWYYNVGAGLSGQVAKDWNLAVRYDLQTQSTSFTSQGVSAKLRYTF